MVLEEKIGLKTLEKKKGFKILVFSSGSMGCNSPVRTKLANRVLVG